MRKLIYAINLSLDGCVDHTKFMPSEDLHEYHINLLKTADTLLYGRVTYQLMVPFWPDFAKEHAGEDNPWNEFANTFVSMDRIVVVSRTLQKADGDKTTIIHDNLKDEMLKLKQQPGKNILVGGVDLPSQLIQLGLVDEYHFVIQPLIVGKGRRLFDLTELQERLQLRLAESKAFPSGTVALHLVNS